MFYKKRLDDENIYMTSPVKMDNEFVEMDSDLFQEGFDGNVYLKTYLETTGYLACKQKFENQETIEECQQYLTDTDYVITKLNELKLEDEDEYETEKAKYADILAKRKECRSKINELETETN